MSQRDQAYAVNGQQPTQPPGQQPPGQQPMQYGTQPPGQQPMQYGTQPPGQQPMQYGQQPGYQMQQGQMPPAGYPGGYQMPQGQMPPAGYPMPPGQMGYGQGMPMQQMPVAWMTKPEISGVPPGLEYLAVIDQLLVKQQVELMELMTGFETQNKYSVRNTMGQQIYFAKEESDACTRNCCGAQRPFTMHITDNAGQEVIQLIRPYKCMCYGQCFSCSDCCQDEVEIQAPIGQIAGYVKQIYEGCEVRYAIQTPERKTVLRIHGPNYCNCHCPGDDIPFNLMSQDGATEVGKVSKQWTNLVQEWFTDADNFGIQFPMDLDVRMKAVVLGAVFLIDFMFFEQNQQNQNRRH